MESFDLVVVNGLVVTASDVAEYDIGIKDEKIALLAPKGYLAKASAKKVIDAQGGYVMVSIPLHLSRVYLSNILTARRRGLPCSPPGTCSLWQRTNCRHLRDRHSLSCRWRDYNYRRVRPATEV